MRKVPPGRKITITLTALEAALLDRMAKAEGRSTANAAAYLLTKQMGLAGPDGLYRARLCGPARPAAAGT